MSNGEIWSLALDGITHSAIVGTTTTSNGQTVNSGNRLATYFDEQFSSATYTVIRSGSMLTISKAGVTPFSSSQTVVGPILTAVSGTASHWSVADIQFTGIASAGDTWHLVLVHPDGSIAEDLQLRCRGCHRQQRYQSGTTSERVLESHQQCRQGFSKQRFRIDLYGCGRRPSAIADGGDGDSGGNREHQRHPASRMDADLSR